MSQTMNSSADEWSRFAPSFIKTAADGPGMLPAHNMVAAADALYPFSLASLVLDIGTGPGQIPSAIFKAHGNTIPESARLVASDFSAGIIEQLEQRKKREIEDGQSLWARLETRICDAADLSTFDDGSVSHAFAGFVLFMVPQARVALSEIRRVLNHQNGGGVFALSSWQGSEWIDLMSFVKKVRPDKVVPQLGPMWHTVEGIRGELEVAGFREVQVYSVETYMPFEDHDEIARYILTEFPGMKRLTSDMTRQELERTRDLMVEDIKFRHPTAPSRLVGTALVGIGRK
ncbi:S-adenosyl-L-methionine-dependent methyltransferase [Lipomyces tetrasporus]|uniref:S-adenosyl-L-methionine-dependent methyltransferase n=1 Tax=Lipomyces tetrasporus TaxID=54092 RepID=A0AAD7VUR4_9ASCO|nr:S-adenosyl-L-methionine-dependent methyltransferase [Lipomyces tetrasporus]KAJ8103402.1 S-adenosyl-L-methionine-dependent methyltransferase [Lipomyces tetrasporus]